MDCPHPSMNVLQPLSMPSRNNFQTQGTYTNDYLPRQTHAQPAPQTRPKFSNVQQSYQHNGWTPENYDLAQVSSDLSVKVQEIQSCQSRVTARFELGQRHLDTEKPHLCRTKAALKEAHPHLCGTKTALNEAQPHFCHIKAALNESQPYHKDIPLHRSPGKTDLTRSYAHVNEAQPDTFEFKPDTSEYTPNLCEVKPDTSDYTPNLCEVKPDTSDYTPNLCEFKPDLNFKSNRVFSLNRHNFRPFVDNRDIAMILFYGTDIPDYSELLKEYSAAAGCTQRPGHAYAAVNCAIDPQLCLSNGVKRTPQITVYSFGNVVRAMAHPEHLQEVHLRKFVEHAPTSLSQ
ncbi:hypothetical protein BsWGS_16997 [Bradybaena similaris]